MGLKFTTEQQKVIQLHERNILVSAAAGSGKTAVLVERIIRMICDEEHPMDIDRLLIVTFTNAAAAEMRERISLGIAGELAGNPQSEHIQKQSALLHNAQITTIDSFCLFLIRNHFNEIGLDPAFRVADEGEIKLLQQDVMKELLEEKFGEKDEAFLNCVEVFCPNGREQVLEQYILDLHGYAASYPWPEEWLLERKYDYPKETATDLEAEGVSEEQAAQLIGQTSYGRFLTAYLQKMLKGCAEKLQRVQRLCEEPDGPYMYGELVEAELEQIERLTQDSLYDLSVKLPAVTFGRLSSKKDDSVSPQKREAAKNLRSQVKDTVSEMGKSFFATPLSLALRQMEACGEPVGVLVDLVLEFGRRMQQRKQEKKLLDFSDMEHYALNILLKKEEGQIVPTPVALEYRQYFQEILIDEYQDSNLVQEYLLRAVSGEEEGRFNRFMVGDVKQSIYKFRLARPELFLEKYHGYTREDGVCQCIDLYRNFRSRTQVVDTVNGVFSGIMSEQTGGIAYDDKAALYAGAVYPENEDCTSELLLIEKPERNGEMSSKEAEGLALANRIKELREHFKVTDKESGELRPVRFRDMVILLRSNSGWDEVFKKVLEQEGIPVYITSKTGYFGATEVQQLLQFLRVLDNPRQDIPLFGIMKSVFGGFTEEEIGLIRSRKKEGSLYEAVRDCGESQKAADFLGMIERYRSYCVYMPIRELLQQIVSDFDYLTYVSSMPAGSKRKANVEMLFTKASDFEKTSYFGLFHFIRYMEQLEKYDVDYGEADMLDENADVVRIMSIHKSKGLEFPVTFVAGLSKRFNMQDINRSLLVDMDMGLGTDYVNPEKRIRNKTLRRLALARKMQEDNLAEEMRVFYVALTRAREKLILTSCVEHAAEKWEMCKEQGAGSFTYSDLMESGSYLDFLLPVLNQSSIEVTIVDELQLTGSRLQEQTKLWERQEKLKNAAAYADEAALQRLRERFAYQYPYGNLEKLYTKTTVSELKIAAMATKDEEAYHAFEEQEVVPYIPDFKKGQESVSGAVRGEAYHKVMELMDFALAEIKEEKEMLAQLECLLDSLVQEGRLSRKYRSILNMKKLLHFLRSPLAERMWKAQQAGLLYREQPFVYGVSAGRLGEQFPAEETVLIQGIVDVFWVEDDKLVLLDYKTDAVPAPEELWNRYETQLDYYEEALCRLTDREMKEKLMYSFHLEQCVSDKLPS